MSHLTVSIALCTYNGEKFLLEQLQSFLTQTILPDEVVVCDDRSSDRTLEILRNFSRNAPFPVRIFINEKNLGSTKNFEKAIALCSGDIIFLSDQDDVWREDKISVFTKIFTENPGAWVVFSNANLVGPELDSLGISLWDSISFNEIERDQFNSEDSVNVLLRHNVVTGAVMAFRKELKGVALPIPSIWYHDAWLAVLSAIVSKNILINVSSIQYRQHETNQVGGMRKSFIELMLNSRQTRLSDYIHVVDQYRELENRLCSLPQYQISSEIADAVSGKIRHYSARAQVSATWLPRISLVFGELLNGGYRKFGGGCKSALRDIISPALNKP